MACVALNAGRGIVKTHISTPAIASATSKAARLRFRLVLSQITASVVYVTADKTY